MSKTPSWLRVSRCRSCQAPIVWGRTEQGKNIPLDATPITGIYSVNLVDGQAKARAHMPVFKQEKFSLHQNHFVTCPSADQHRKDRS